MNLRRVHSFHFQAIHDHVVVDQTTPWLQLVHFIYLSFIVLDGR